MSALRIDQLFVRSFRNLKSLDLVPGPRFNVVSGDNGAGKTNLLEAIAYVASLRSFRGSPQDELIERGSASATLAAKIGSATLTHSLKVRLHRAGDEGRKPRELALDDKRPRSVGTWISVCPTVVFHPGDLELAQSGPEARRTLLDRVLAEIDPAYGAMLATYQRALRSRNRLLKHDGSDRDAICAYDPILAKEGAGLVRIRRELLQSIAPATVQAFTAILGADVPLDVRYAPRVDGDQADLARALERSFDKDRARGFTAEGPHADDVSLQVHAHAARHHASQGQQRTIVLALKIAELEVLRGRSGRTPILLLDDVSSELDRTRNRRFFELLARLGGQVFLTTTHREFILLEQERVDWHVRAGVIERVVS